MLVVEMVATIRRERLVGGKGIKTIARELGLSRNTVRKVLRSGQTSFAFGSAIVVASIFGPTRARLKADGV